MTLEVLINRPEYDFRLERCDIGKVLHQNVKVPYTKRIRRMILADLEHLKLWHGELLVAVPHGNLKLIRYAWSLGFLPKNLETNIDGEEFLIMSTVY